MRTPKILKCIEESNINYFQSWSNYTLLRLQNGQTVVSGYNIKVFETIYKGNNFIKINRSKLVNLTFINRAIIDGNTCKVQLINGEEINISRRRVKKIIQAFPMIF